VRENIAAREEAHELLTFGIGPGRCLGRAFNMLESFVLLDGIMSRFEVELPTPTPRSRSQPPPSPDRSPGASACA
jgi:cytochrome P450